jgi:hypothetical protein
VFGELEAGTKTKKPKVAIMMIGEQPGDQEDKQGRPFVGPAGKLLDKCLEEADIDRRKVYVTNTVKHFRWGTTRRTSHSQETQHERDPCLQALAGSGTRGCSPRTNLFASERRVRNRFSGRASKLLSRMA